MKKTYRKIPVVVEAVQWTGDNIGELVEFAEREDKTCDIMIHDEKTLYVKTLNGWVLLNNREYVIKGVNGEFYPCAEDIFHKTYEEV